MSISYHRGINGIHLFKKDNTSNQLYVTTQPDSTFTPSFLRPEAIGADINELLVREGIVPLEDVYISIEDALRLAPNKAFKKALDSSEDAALKDIGIERVRGI